jgi:hypothetical protein
LKKGNFKHGFVFAGQNAYRAESIISVEEMVDTLKSEFDEAKGGHDD